MLVQKIAEFAHTAKTWLTQLAPMMGAKMATIATWI